MRTLALFLIISVCFEARSQTFSFRHEEDEKENCDLTGVPYPVHNLSLFIDELQKILNFELSRINIVYDRQGSYAGTVINEHAPPGEPKGIVLDDIAPISGLGYALTTKKVLQTFTFNDAVQDIGASPPAWIDLKFSEKIPVLLGKSEVHDPKNQKDKYKFARDNATSRMDFRLSIMSDYVLIDGVLYNRPDAGNFIWGSGMRALGFSYLEVKLGSEINGALKTREQNNQEKGIILLGDSDKDQAAIKRGFYSSYWKTNLYQYTEEELNTRAMHDKASYKFLLDGLSRPRTKESRTQALVTLTMSPLADKKGLDTVIDYAFYSNFLDPFTSENITNISSALVIAPNLSSGQIPHVFDGIISSDKLTEERKKELILTLARHPDLSTQNRAYFLRVLRKKDPQTQDLIRKLEVLP